MLGRMAFNRYIVRSHTRASLLPSPQLPRSHDLAVEATARAAVTVVPPMIGADGFAVLTFGADTEVDQKPRKAPRSHVRHR